MRNHLTALALMSGTAVARQANDDGGSATPGKKRQAKHGLLDSAWASTDDETLAHGVTYELLALPGRTFTYKFGENADADRMLAIFGAKTLATNESSAARNDAKGEASPEEQMDAVVERFALLSTGQWVDRTGGVGAKVNLDALAEAIFAQLTEEGKVPSVNKAGAAITPDDYRAALRQKLDDDKVYVRKARTNPQVNARYAAIVGRSQATTDDLAAI